MNSARMIVIGSFIGAVLAAIVAMFIPQPASWEGSSIVFRLPLVLTCAYVAFHLGAGALFVGTLDVYKAKLRRAYIAIAIGIVLLGLATLQLPIIGAFAWWDATWVTGGGVVLPFVLSGIITYSGVRSFARLVNVKSLLTRFSVVLPLALVLSIFSTFLPHVAVSTPEMSYDISNAIMIWILLLYLLSGLVARQVLRSIGAHYTQAMVWLMSGLFGSAVVLVVSVGRIMLISIEQDNMTILVAFLGLIAGLLYLMAGYAFAKTREY